MKINKKNNKKYIITASIAALLVVFSVIFFIYFNKPATQDQKTTTDNQKTEIDQRSTNYDSATSEQIDAGVQQKKSTLENSDSSNTDSSSLNVLITSISKNDENNTLQVRTLIEAVTNSGTCNISLKNGSKVVSLESGIQAGPTSSTCKGFDVDLSTLGTGDWAVTVKAKTGSSEGVASATYKL